MENLNFEVGDLLIIETGEYSDKGWDGPVRVIRSFSKVEISKLFESSHPPEEWHDKPQSYDFLAWLTKEGYVEDVPNVHSWHVGCYGDFEPGV